MSLTVLACTAAPGVFWHGSRALAQPALLGTANNFTMSEYYHTPYDTQMKSLISGREAQPKAGGQYLIKGLRIETFNEKGGRETIAEAPDCLYDGTKRIASSPSHIRAFSERGQFVVAGDGFLWRQDESRLIISNRVHTIVQNTTPAP